MKRIWFFVFTALLAFCASGNRDTITSLDRAMVHAVGIDADEEGYRVTLQIFRPDSAGTDTQLDPAKANVFVISAAAETVGQAMSLCENRLGEFLFIGHDQLVVIGEGVSLKDAQLLLSSLYKSKESYLGARAAWTENASKLLNAELAEGAVSAESIVQIIERHEENSGTVRCDLLDAIGGGSGTLILPRLKLTGSGEGKTVSAAGAVVFVDGERRFTLDSEQCSGVSALRRKSCAAVLNYETSGGPAAVEVRHISCRRSLEAAGGRLRCCLSVTGEIRNDQSIELLDSGGDLTAQCEEELLRRCAEVIALCRRENADLIGLRQLAKSSQPQMWLELDGDFSKLLDMTDLSLEVNISLKG